MWAPSAYTDTMRFREFDFANENSGTESLANFADGLNLQQTGKGTFFSNASVHRISMRLIYSLDVHAIRKPSESRRLSDISRP
jgi:hypothetical protein